jgi:hypothetical protein
MDYKQKYLKYKMKYLQTKNYLNKNINIVNSLKGGSATSSTANVTSLYTSDNEFNKLSPTEKFCYNINDIYYKKINSDINSDIDSEEYSPPEFISITEYRSESNKIYKKFYNNNVLYYGKKEQQEIDNIITELTKNTKNYKISQGDYNELDDSIKLLYYTQKDKSNLSGELIYILNHPFLSNICQTKIKLFESK